jgi:hypothetical protein
MRGSFIMDSSDIMMVWLGGSVADSIILHVKWNKLIRKVYQWWQPQWPSSSMDLLHLRLLGVTALPTAADLILQSTTMNTKWEEENET